MLNEISPASARAASLRIEYRACGIFYSKSQLSSAGVVLIETEVAMAQWAKLARQGCRMVSLNAGRQRTVVQLLAPKEEAREKGGTAAAGIPFVIGKAGVWPYSVYVFDASPWFP